MNPSVGNLALSILASGTFIAIVNALFQRRKVGAETRKTDVEVEKIEAETAALIQETSAELVRDAREREKDLRSQIKGLETEAVTDRLELRDLREREASLRRRLNRLESTVDRLEGREAAWNAFADETDAAISELGGTPVPRPRFT